MRHDTAERLRKLLQAHLGLSGTTQGKLAKHLGLSSSAISRILSGQRQMSAEELILIKDYFSLSFADFQKALDLGPEIELEAANELYQQGLRSVKIAPFNNEGDAFIHLPKEFFSSHKISQAESLRWVRIFDDAMAPTIVRGDVLVIDTSTIGAVGLYVLETGPAQISVRRLEFDRYVYAEDGEIDYMLLYVTADNPKFRSYGARFEQLKLGGAVLMRVTSSLA